MRVTGPNLLAWYDSTPEDSLFPEQVIDCRKGALVTYPGENTWFFMNLKVPLNSASSINPGFIESRTSGTANSISSAVSVYTYQESGKKTVYGRLTCPAVASGLYRWRLVIDGITYTSTLIEVMSAEEAKACSIYCDYSANKTLHGIRYPWIDGLHQALRIRAMALTPTYPEEVSTYREVSTGIPVHYNQASDKVYSFKVPFTNNDILEGLNSMLLHDTISFNGRPVRKRENMSPTQANRGNLATATFSVYDLTYAQSLIP